MNIPVKVSVIIPVYNVEKYLTACLDSIINQTLRDIEVICVDDGSIDHSLAILKKYANKDSRIKIIVQKNQGQGAARNHALKKAVGKYLLFVDADDWLELDCLEKLYAHAEKVKSDLCIYGAKQYDEVDQVFLKNAYYTTQCYTKDGDAPCTYKGIKATIFMKKMIGFLVL